MLAYVDKPKIHDLRNGTTALSFTVVLYSDNEIKVVIPGFRLIDGKINAPSFKLGKKGTYYPMAYFGPGEVKAIYQALAEAPWPEKAKLSVPLATFEQAVSGLEFTATAAAAVTPGLFKQQYGEAGA